ncbi:MAG: hypothetical protein Q4A41_00195 [Bacillota bacterium]|nr:hypothetical protein [Bacillota bacterium]
MDSGPFVKKKNKKTVLVLFFLILLTVVLLTVYAGVRSAYRQKAFLLNRQRVLVYVAKQYEFECRLVNHRIGDYAYPVPRESDTFVFYDTRHGMYFKIYCNDDGIISDYYEVSTIEEPDLDD